MNKIAIVTGGNRGIGFEICRQFALRGLKVILTGRSKDRIQQATEKLHQTNLEVYPMVLDLASRNSIAGFVEEYKKLYHHVDILVHNAAILTTEDREFPLSKVDIATIEQTMTINFLGPLYLNQLLLPLLSEGSRIINISARPALFRHLTSQMPAYRLSKLALNGMAVILHQELREKGIIITSMHPGWVRTDMGGPNAHRPVEEGVDTAIWLALDAPEDVGGKFYMDRQVLDW